MSYPVHCERSSSQSQRSEAVWSASNSVARSGLLSYYPTLVIPLPLPEPSPFEVSGTTSPTASLDDTLLEQVLAQFARELRNPMSAEVVAQIEEQTPEIPAQFDIATYEYARDPELDAQ